MTSTTLKLDHNKHVIKEKKIIDTLKKKENLQYEENIYI